MPGKPLTVVGLDREKVNQFEKGCKYHSGSFVWEI
jgi:hypothetical protein